MKLYKIPALVWEESWGGLNAETLFGHFRVIGNHCLYMKGRKGKRYCVGNDKCSDDDVAKARAEELHVAEIEKWLEVAVVGFITPSGNQIISAEC